MSKRLPLGIVLALLVIAVAVTAVVTVKINMEKYNELIADLPQRTQQYSMLSELDALVRKEYYGQPDAGLLNTGLAGGYLEGLNDERCFYIPAENCDAYEEYISGHIAGTGISAVYDAESGYLRVLSVEENSSAASAGIHPEDRIAFVDGSAVSDKNSNKLIGILTGSGGDIIKLGLSAVNEDGEEIVETYDVKNGYEVVSCSYEITGSVGIVRLSGFYADTLTVFNKALDKFSEEGVTGMIIDVRNNTSNNIAEAVKIIDRIVPLASGGTGAIATAKNAEGKDMEIYSADSASISLPIAVLVNDRTEGAAELLACDLRDFGKAKLFGEKTAGNGMLQKLYRLDDGSAVVLNCAKIYPYVSDPFDGVGVMPDEVVPMSEAQKNILPALEPGEDAPYRQAFTYLADR